MITVRGKIFILHNAELKCVKIVLITQGQDCKISCLINLNQQTTFYILEES
jgi:hypothetical protein